MPELMWRDLQAELLPETLRDLFRQGLRGFVLPAGPGEEPIVIEALHQVRPVLMDVFVDQGRSGLVEGELERHPVLHVLVAKCECLRPLRCAGIHDA
jgi:hypothetical protein